MQSVYDVSSTDGKASSSIWHVEAVPILWMKGPHAGMLPFLYSVNKNP